MSSDLWSSTLTTYARPASKGLPGIAGAGANVCLLLCAVWLGQRGVARNAQRLQQLHQLADPWHDDVVKPLRQLRQQWRSRP